MKYCFLGICILISIILVCGCSQPSDPQVNSNQTKITEKKTPMRMSVSNGVNGSNLSRMYSCFGPGQVPSVFWKDEPEAAQSMVLIMDDPDAPNGVFTHWIVYNLSPKEEGIPPNQLPMAEKAGSGLQGLNSMKTRGYNPPCPPGGSRHRYVFTLSALDTIIKPEYADRANVESAMNGHVIATAKIVTFFGE